MQVPLYYCIREMLQVYNAMANMAVCLICLAPRQSDQTPPTNVPTDRPLVQSHRVSAAYGCLWGRVGL